MNLEMVNDLAHAMSVAYLEKQEELSERLVVAAFETITGSTGFAIEKGKEEGAMKYLEAEGFEFASFEDVEGRNINSKLFAMKDGSFFKGYYVEIDISHQRLRVATFYPNDVEEFDRHFRATKRLEELLDGN